MTVGERDKMRGSAAVLPEKTEGEMLTVVADGTRAPEDPVCVDRRLVRNTADVERVARVSTDDTLRSTFVSDLAGRLHMMGCLPRRGYRDRCTGREDRCREWGCWCLHTVVSVISPVFWLVKNTICK